MRKIGFSKVTVICDFRTKFTEILLNKFKGLQSCFLKLIKALICYEGLNRVEKYGYPKEAIREALLNAIAYKDYSGGVPTLLSSFREKFMVLLFFRCNSKIITWKVQGWFSIV